MTLVSLTRPRLVLTLTDSQCVGEYAGGVYTEEDHVFQLEGQLRGILYPILGWNCKEWAVGFGARALGMCPHFGHVTVFICLVCEVKVERVAASPLVVFPGLDVDMYGRRACVRVFVGVLRWD